MLGTEFKKFRKLCRIKGKVFQKALGYLTYKGYMYHESKDEKAPVIFTMFYNYINRYGLKKAIKDFTERFR